MAKDPAFLFYDADAARDVSHMNRLERGAYFDIMQAQRKFGRLTPAQIEKVLRKDYKKCWNSISLVMTMTDGKYYIQWLEESTEKRKAYSKSRGANRWKHKSAEAVPVEPEHAGAKEPLVQQMADVWKSVINGYAFSKDDDYRALLDFARFICDQIGLPLNMLKTDPVLVKWKQMIRVIDDHPSWRKKSLLNLAKFNKQEIYGRIQETDEKKMVI
jgi:hypothetical protein